MRVGLLILGMWLAFGVGTCQRARLRTPNMVTSNLVAPASTLGGKPDFDKQIKPIFQSR